MLQTRWCKRSTTFKNENCCQYGIRSVSNRCRLCVAYPRLFCQGAGYPQTHAMLILLRTMISIDSCLLNVGLHAHSFATFSPPRETWHQTPVTRQASLSARVRMVLVTTNNTPHTRRNNETDVVLTACLFLLSFSQARFAKLPPGHLGQV